MVIRPVLTCNLAFPGRNGQWEVSGLNTLHYTYQTEIRPTLFLCSPIHPICVSSSHAVLSAITFIGGAYIPTLITEPWTFKKYGETKKKLRFHIICAPNKILLPEWLSPFSGEECSCVQGSSPLKFTTPLKKKTACRNYPGSFPIFTYFSKENFGSGSVHKLEGCGVGPICCRVIFLFYSFTWVIG